MKKIDYIYMILILLVLCSVYYLYKCCNKEHMSTSIIGNDTSGKDFDITINNYPNMKLLRDKYIAYYRHLDKDQKKNLNKYFLKKEH